MTTIGKITGGYPRDLMIFETFKFEDPRAIMDTRGRDFLMIGLRLEIEIPSPNSRYGSEHSDELLPCKILWEAGGHYKTDGGAWSKKYRHCELTPEAAKYIFGADAVLAAEDALIGRYISYLEVGLMHLYALSTRWQRGETS